MNLLTMKNIGKAYTDKVLLDGVDFGLSEGERVGVIGINGTGKSTFLKILAGEEEPDSGEIAMGNQVKICYLSQTPRFPEGETLYEYVGKDRPEGEVQSLLNRLGFSSWDMPVETLSGGQRKKAALARALLTPCDVLVLDEPTNHLDQDMICWLENYLLNWKHALVMVTHDRYFLDRVCRRIVEIDRGKLYSYQTNYEGFLEEKAAREDRELATYRKNRSILRKELEWVKRGARARSTKQKARLERYETLKEQKAPKQEETVEIQSASSRLGKKTLELSHVEKRYGDRQIIRDFSYIFLKQDRIGIIGKNGCGKSTLMKIIAGELAPDGGEREVGSTVKIGYFSQENEKLREEERVIDYIRDTAEYVRIGNELISASMMLERFLFDSALQYSRIEKLSGGEKRRLYLLKVLMSAPNLLLLDEPTNDLDIQTLAILEDYLDDFPGIVVTVSHDRYFLDRIAERIFAFQEDGSLQQYEGGFSDYLEAREQRERPQAASSALAGEQKKEKTEKPRHQEKLKFTYKEQKEYETIEADIAALEESVASLERQIEKAATDFVKLSELTREKETTEALLEEKMERYLYLSDLEERIKAQ